VDGFCAQWASEPSAYALGGILPHAGWLYSGNTAGATVAALKGQEPDTCVVFGAVHVHGVSHPALSDHSGWKSPLGTVACDMELGKEILRRGMGMIVADGEAHQREHSIEIEVPFLQRNFPRAKLLALMVPAAREAVRVGEIAAEAAGALGRRVLYLGSTDLTHYGPRYGFTPRGIGMEALRWCKETNDRRMLDLIRELRAEDAVPEAAGHRNACGAGAIAAALAAARSSGATRGEILCHTTSHDVLPEGSPTDFVGYAAAVFLS
jgi:AmmeMemoRadiSam system protein B